MLRQILNAILDIVVLAAYSHLSALLIKGSTFHAAVYLECCLHPCGGPLKALFCFYPSCLQVRAEFDFLKTTQSHLGSLGSNTPVP